MSECCKKELPELFGSDVFNDAVQRARLPKNIYKKLRETIDEARGRPIP